MRVLTEAQCLEWITEAGLPEAITDATRAPGRYTMCFHKEERADHQMLLVDGLLRWMGHGEVLLWIQDWGACYSPEIHRLFMEQRQTQGNALTLMQAPGHLLDLGNPPERAVAWQSCMFMSAFTWLGMLIRPEVEPFVWFADEVLECSTGRPEKWAELEALATDFRLRVFVRDTPDSVSSD